MKKSLLAPLAMALLPAYAWAVDGQTLINQSTVMAAGGFPYKITQTGSYKLSGNLTVPDANTTAILIQADHVTLDLNGFSILGPTVCTGAPVTSCSPTGTGGGVDGINHSHNTVLNGFVSGMGKFGVYIESGGNNSGNQVERVHADSNGQWGILADGSIKDSSAEQNGGDGITSAGLGIASGNRAYGNGGVGIFGDGLVIGNQAVGNHQGIFATGTIISNYAGLNTTTGIYVICPSSVVGNAAFANGTNLSDLTGCVFANNSAP